jgi:hypothetical protein
VLLVLDASANRGEAPREEAAAVATEEDDDLKVPAAFR